MKNDVAYELRSARFLAADVRKRVVMEGDTVIDATLGNGHDTLELAGLVGETGHVYGFDIQADAVEHTCLRLENEGMLNRCTLFQLGHEHMLEKVTTPVRYVSFNLGWLPGGDKSITTLWPTTKKALQSALSLLLPLGVCTVCAYPGHLEGDRERSELMLFLSHLRPQDFNVLHQHFLNAGEGSPECFVIQKQTSCSYQME
ncbi:MAG: methyltransferase domain-containing protein [Clostridiales bacterium]|nr:methyltransferase domain-containing protein [Clostridiales bacterium]